jgi:hypothetical protein
MPAPVALPEGGTKIMDAVIQERCEHNDDIRESDDTTF